MQKLTFRSKNLSILLLFFLLLVFGKEAGAKKCDVKVYGLFMPRDFKKIQKPLERRGYRPILGKNVTAHAAPIESELPDSDFLPWTTHDTALGFQKGEELFVITELGSRLRLYAVKANKSFSKRYAASLPVLINQKFSEALNFYSLDLLYKVEVKIKGVNTQGMFIPVGAKRAYAKMFRNVEKCD